MSHPLLERYFRELAAAWPQGDDRDAALDELRDHLLSEYEAECEAGLEPDEAAGAALASWGEPAALARRFSNSSFPERGRWIMRLSTAAMVAGVLMAIGVALWWPDDRQPPAIRTAQAQAPVTSAVAKVDSSIEVNNQATREKLAQRIKVEYVGVPATDVLLDLKEKLKIEFYVDEVALSPQAIELGAPIVTMRFEKIRGDMLLDLLVQQVGGDSVDYVIRDGIVIITTVESLNGASEVKAYPVADLLRLHARLGDDASPASPGGEPGGSMGHGSGAGPVRIVDAPRAAQQLINVITNTIAPDTWASLNPEGHGSIEYYGGMFIVRQNARTHREVEKFLAMLRATAAQHERGQAGQPLDR